MARERAGVVAAVQEGATGLGARWAVPRTAPNAALVLPTVTSPLALLVADVYIAAFHFFHRPFAATFLFLS